MAKRFADLSEREILALAISSEEDDSRIYGDIAEGRRRGDGRRKWDANGSVENPRLSPVNPGTYYW